MELQIVEYVADEEGYRPEIRYEGEAYNRDQGIIGSTGAGRNNGQSKRPNGLTGAKGYPSGGAETNSGNDGTNLQNGYQNDGSLKSGVSGYASGSPGQSGFSGYAGVGQNIGTAAPGDLTVQESNSGYPGGNPNERGISAVNRNGANSGYSGGRSDDFGYPNDGFRSGGNVDNGYLSQANMAGYPNSGPGPNGNDVSSNQEVVSGYPSGGPGAENNVTLRNSVVGLADGGNSFANSAFAATNGRPSVESGYPNRDAAQSGYSSGRPENGKNYKQNEADGSTTAGHQSIGGAAGYPSGSPSIRGTGY